MISWFRYVPHDMVEDFLAVGWIIVDDMQGTHHGAYSVLMKYTGEGEPK